MESQTLLEKQLVEWVITVGKEEEKVERIKNKLALSTAFTLRNSWKLISKNRNDQLTIGEIEDFFRENNNIPQEDIMQLLTFLQGFPTKYMSRNVFCHLLTPANKENREKLRACQDSFQVIEAEAKTQKKLILQILLKEIEIEKIINSISEFLALNDMKKTFGLLANEENNVIDAESLTNYLNAKGMQEEPSIIENFIYRLARKSEGKVYYDDFQRSFCLSDPIKKLKNFESPLRERLKDLEQTPPKCLNPQERDIENVKQMSYEQPIEEKSKKEICTLANILKDEGNAEMELEAIKQSIPEDGTFSAVDAFRLFDIKGKCFSTYDDFHKGLTKLDNTIQYRDSYLLFRFLDKDMDHQLKFCNFASLIIPKNASYEEQSAALKSSGREGDPLEFFIHRQIETYKDLIQKSLKNQILFQKLLKDLKQNGDYITEFKNLDVNDTGLISSKQV